MRLNVRLEGRKEYPSGARCDSVVSPGAGLALPLLLRLESEAAYFDHATTHFGFWSAGRCRGLDLIR